MFAIVGRACEYNKCRLGFDKRRTLSQTRDAADDGQSFRSVQPTCAANAVMTDGVNRPHAGPFGVGPACPGNIFMRDARRNGLKA